jgi:hypothetical protein
LILKYNSNLSNSIINYIENLKTTFKNSTNDLIKLNENLSHCQIQNTTIQSNSVTLQSKNKHFHNLVKQNKVALTRLKRKSSLLVEQSQSETTSLRNKLEILKNRYFHLIISTTESQFLLLLNSNYFKNFEIKMKFQFDSLQ